MQGEDEVLGAIEDLRARLQELASRVEELELARDRQQHELDELNAILA